MFNDFRYGKEVREKMGLLFDIEKLKTTVDQKDRKAGNLSMKVDTLKVELDNSNKSTQDIMKEQNRLIMKQDKKILNLEDEKKKLEDEIEEIKLKHSNELNELTRTKDEKIIKMKNDMISLKNQLNSLIAFKNEKHKFEEELETLKENLKSERFKRVTELAEKEKEKMDSMDKLRKQMFEKIKETKETFLKTNEVHLQNTTKLTIMQNNQLINELNFHSQHTEKLLERNKKLEEEIQELKRENAINKQMGSDFAEKTAVQSRAIIKLRGKLDSYNNSSKNQNQNINEFSPNDKSFNKINNINNINNNEELFKILENKLNENEIKMKRSSEEYEKLKKDYGKLNQNFQKISDKANNVAFLLIEFLDNILSPNHDWSTIPKNIELDVEKIKNNDFASLNINEKSALVLILLKQLQPFLTENNLSLNNKLGEIKLNKLNDINNIIGKMDVKQSALMHFSSIINKSPPVNLFRLPKISKSHHKRIQNLSRNFGDSFKYFNPVPWLHLDTKLNKFGK